MNKDTTEIIGQMFIDDSNWISTNAEDMTKIIRDCNTFVSFHGLKFNQKKCEYMAINQQDSRREGSEYAAWELPKWPSGENIMPKARQIEERHKWEKEHADIIDQLNRYEGGCIDMDDPGKEHPVTEQPTKEALVRVKVMIMKWKKDIQAGEDGREQAEQRRERVTESLNKMKAKAYGEATEEEIKESTEAWATNWQQWVGLEIMHSINIEQATRYLGVFFNMNLSWREQIKVTRAKFTDMHERISRTKPTAEMAIYCTNAVINAALRFPLQVAAIPVTVLREWDEEQEHD